MNGDIAEDPLARAVLRHMAAARGKDDPMGSLARTVLNGEATLQAAARDSWHGKGLATAFQGAQDELNRMSSERRATYERDAARLRSEPPAEHDADRDER
ncbi:hypothetical protein [Actinoplanes sp. NPDC049118]|uniref:hypothetical protein n=1 Tax=Actinoplanes sp. NPDC049118 TaxID=3155769 RepID=UPI0033CFE70D